MYYWISLGIHTVLALTVLAFGLITLRYFRMKPKISKVTVGPGVKKSQRILTEEHADAVDPNTLYK